MDGMSESILAQPPLLTIDSRLDTDTRKNWLAQETNLIARWQSLKITTAPGAACHWSTTELDQIPFKRLQFNIRNL